MNLCLKLSNFSVISPDKWEQLIAANSWNNVELRDNRYNHIVHMVSAANGAVEFYSTEVNILVDDSSYLQAQHYIFRYFMKFSLLLSESR